MKDKFFWALLSLIIASAAVDILNLTQIRNRVTALEEKAKHFRCLEKRINRLKPMRIKGNPGGGWYIIVDSVKSETR